MKTTDLLQPTSAAAAVLLGLFVAMFAGCADSDEPELPPLFPVQGAVVYRGKPASGFRVTFHPLGDIGEVKFAPAAITESDGTFRLRSYEPDDGAPAGEYAVTLEWPDHIIKAEDFDPKPEVDQLRGAYSNPERSKFKVTVHDGPNELKPFVLP